MDPIKVAIIGQGRSGRDIHGAALIKDPRFKIVAVVDLLENRRQGAVREYACEALADYHDLLRRRELGLIVNATPSHLHVPVTLEFLKAGFNVLCEKPLAPTAAAVDKLITAARKARKVLAAFQQSHYADYFIKLREIIDSGVLGRIVQIACSFGGFNRRWDWQTLQSWNGGNLMNTGPHPLEQVLQLFGAGRPKVVCYMDRVNTAGDAEDFVKVILSGPGHPLIEMDISSCNAYPCYTYHLQGSCGGLKGNQRQMEWKYFRPEENPLPKLITEPICNPQGLPSYCREELQWHTGAWPETAAAGSQSAAYDPSKAVQNNPTQRFYNMLYQTLTTGAPLEVPLALIRRMAAVFEECRRQNPQIYRKSRK